MPSTPDLPSDSEKRKSLSGLLRDTVMLLLVVGLLSASAFWPGAAGADPDDEEKEVRILFELRDDNASARQDVFNRVDATIESFDELATVAVLLSNDGSKLAQSDSPAASRLERFAERGITLLVCKDALEWNEIEPGNLLGSIATVESAEEEIRDRESRNWVFVPQGSSYVSSLPDEDT